MKTAEREFDLVVWGASGFTGRLVAEHLAERVTAGMPLRWALGGRNESKLHGIRSGLGADFAELPVLVADSHDPDALASLAARTAVVISTVGPYALYGSELVAACAAAGTDYCDLAGETQWIRRMIIEHEATAQQTGARIVHCCGFDSIPFDLGVFAAQRAMQEQHGVYARDVTGLMRKMKGEFSGGTFASMINLMKEASVDKDLRRQLRDLAMLIPDAERSIRSPACETRVCWCPEGDTWTAPFVMSPVNTRIVQRSHALLGNPWADALNYEEAMATGSGVKGRTRANLMTMGTGAMMMAAAIGPTRSLLERLMPKPGEGPDEQSRLSGHYRAEFIAHHPENRALDVLLAVTGDRDPGYGSTSKMLAESALCLAFDALDTQGGSWTPASAMGAALISRLEAHAGMAFSVQ